MQIWKPLSKKSKRRPSSSALHRHRRPRHSPSHLPPVRLAVLRIRQSLDPRRRPHVVLRRHPHRTICTNATDIAYPPAHHATHATSGTASSPPPSLPGRPVRIATLSPAPSLRHSLSVRPPPGAPESVTRFISILEVFYIDAAPSVIPTYLCNPFCPSVFPSSRPQCQVTSGALSSVPFRSPSSLFISRL
ncbi:hypothetical protein VTO73DRAFT_11547 [Trametes versicolor]